MKNGHNLLTRPRVHFQIRPPPDSAEKMFGHRPSAPITIPTKKTTTSQVSSKEKLLAELLRDLSGNSFPQLASALLPQLGYREPTAQKRKRSLSKRRRRRSSSYSDTSGEDSYEKSRSFSSGDEDSDDTCFTSTPDIQVSPIGTDEEADSLAIQTRLAPLPGQRNFKGLGPKI